MAPPYPFTAHSHTLALLLACFAPTTLVSLLTLKPNRQPVALRVRLLFPLPELFLRVCAGLPFTILTFEHHVHNKPLLWPAFTTVATLSMPLNSHCFALTQPHLLHLLPIYLICVHFPFQNDNSIKTRFLSHYLLVCASSKIIYWLIAGTPGIFVK